MKTSIVALMVGALLTGSVTAAEINVQAAASLSDVLKEIASGYEAASGDKLQFNFGASSALARQIEAGAPADVFFSADEAKLDALEKKGLILADTRKSLLSNVLVVVVAADAPFVPKEVNDLAKTEITKLALAEPQTVPAGIYAREYLQKRGLWEMVREKVVPTENVRAALAAVASGNAQAGIVYKTDALGSPKVKIAIEVPAAEGPEISYPLAVLKASKVPDRARKFAEYLRSQTAQTIFKKFGFIVPN